MFRLSLTVLFLFALPVFAQRAEPITEEQAIEIAKQAFIAEGGDLDRYNDPVAMPYCERAIFFSLKQDPDGGAPLGSTRAFTISGDGKKVESHLRY